MNAKRAKREIVSTIRAYLTKDEYGQYLIPKNKQRPLLLIGPPGIGKTELVVQVAAELNVGFLGYSMTHHTRQSAVDTPVIRRKVVGSTEIDVSVHTMDEISSTIQDMVNISGIEKGILFIDEINHVSEMNDPVMQRFVQNKLYNGSIPDGWVVITAGNLPEYNSTARNFDISTLDKFKCINIEPDFDIWKDYAYRVGMNAAVMVYLAVKPQNFYRIDRTEQGVQFVTARGWEDLSCMLNACEKNGVDPDEAVVSEYLQHDDIIKDFTAFYYRYLASRKRFDAKAILVNGMPPEFKAHLNSADIEKRYVFIGILLDEVCKTTRHLLRGSRVFNAITGFLKGTQSNPGQILDMLKGAIEKDEGIVAKAKAAHNMMDENAVYYAMKLYAMNVYRAEAASGGYANVRDAYNTDAARFKGGVEKAKTMYSNLFNIYEEVYGEDSKEMAALVTELAGNAITSSYIANFGCEEYHKYDKTDVFKEKYDELLKEVAQMYIPDVER